MNSRLSLLLDKPTPTQPSPDRAVETIDSPLAPKGIVHSGRLSQLLVHLSGTSRGMEES
jgi:hypothetical protein